MCFLSLTLFRNINETENRQYITICNPNEGCVKQ